MLVNNNKTIIHAKCTAQQDISKSYLYFLVGEPVLKTGVTGFPYKINKTNSVEFVMLYNQIKERIWVPLPRFSAVDGSELRDWIMDHHSLLADDISTSSWLPWRTWTGWNERSEKQLSTETTLFLSRFGTFLRSEMKFLKWPKKQFLISLNKLQMIMYNFILFPTLSITYVDQNVLQWVSVE